MKNKLILIAILLLAAFLRLYRISDFPAGFNADEAALGYNAYSLMTTGRDEHGHPWPVNLESFGDFKPALYAYLLIPFIKIFGLTEFAVRLPSALAGILSVYLIYLITNYLTPIPSPNLGEGSQREKVLGLISAFLLAISPWHLHFSRGAWEVNLASTFILAGIYFFVLYIKNKKFINFALCTLHFALSMYSYQSSRIIAPLLGLGLFIFYFRKLIKYPKHFFIGVLTLTLTLTPLLLSVVRFDAASRFSGVGFTSDPGPVNRVNELRGQHPGGMSVILSKALHNKPVIFTIQFAKNYLSHFDGNFLFVNGDTIARNRVPETGLLYLTDVIFLALGGFLLLRRPGPNTKIIWLWLFIAPVASALTFQVPHALRAQMMLYPLTIIMALGIYKLFACPSKPWRRRVICYLLFVICYLWQISRYLHQYYIHYPQTYPAAWEYGFKDLTAYVNSVRDRYDKILITDFYDQPYILYLFYSRYPPEKFQDNHQLTVRDKFNFSTVRSFDKFEFTSTPWEKVRDIHSALIVAAPGDIPEVGVHVVKTIYFPNNQPAFKIISN
jgi:4-amino-4-deoxy-L-arabinose transferase-like glycosyltransferase